MYHPDLARIARFIPRGLVGPKTAPVMRYLSRRMGRSVPDGVEVLTLSSGVTLRLHRPRGVAKPGPALLWMHGGGYVLGSPAQDDKLCRRYAGELGATVAAVQYRLAPQNPYPAGLEDCYAALTWLAQLPTVDPSRLAIGGASAGGGMAAALALLARDRGEVPLAAQVLVYPMLDDRTVGPESTIRGTGCGPRAATDSAGGPIWAGPIPRWRSPRATRTCPGLRPPGSASAPTTCFTTRTWPMRSACARPGSRSRSRWSRGRSTVSMP